MRSTVPRYDIAACARHFDPFGDSDPPAVSGEGLVVIPILFGSRERLLAGVYSPALGGSSGRAVLLCPPMGQEYLRAHRTGRILADRMAAAGFDVLRFDYYGAGESAGEGEEVSLDGAVDDVVEAANELEALANARTVSLVGVRFGAVVAALALQDLPVDRLVLCDPVLEGSTYLEELRSLADAPADLDDGHLQVQGFPFSVEFQEALAEFGPEELPELPRRLLAVAVAEPAGWSWLSERVADRLPESHGEIVPEEPYWQKMEGVSVGSIPTSLVARIVEWLG